MGRLKMKWAFFLLLSLCCTSLFAQERDVDGVVVDGKSGEHLPGAIISAKGRPSNVSSRADGTFTIKLLPTDSVIVVSYIGYKRVQMKVGDEKFVTVRMDSTVAEDLNDVVVVGYGTQSKRDITGSMATVNLKQLEDIPAASISEMLRGQVPGLNVTGGSQRPGILATLDIRQQFNWGKDGGNTAPLIVIDDVLQLDPQTGLPTLDRFNQLDLSEIESITVIRDASAAIYGSRASQGVIVIKTKRGKAGAPRVTYNGKFERNDAVSHGKVMNARQYGEFANSVLRAQGNTEKHMYTQDELNMMDTLDYDWLMNDWRAAGTMQHSLNISGGADNATYFMGASYYTQGANLGSQDFKRWTYRAGSDIKLASGLHLGATLAAANTNVEKSFTKINFSDGFANGGEQNDYSVLLHMPKYIPWVYNIDGQNQYISPPLGPHRVGSIKGNRSVTNWNYYALLNNGSKTTNKDFNYNVNVSLQYDVPFIPGLNFKLNYGLSQASGNTEQIMMPQMLYQAASMADDGQHLFSETTKWKSQLNNANARVTYDNTTSKNEQSNFFINYARSFGDHNISAMVSVEKSTNSLEDRYQIYDDPIPGVYNGTSVSAGTLNPSNTITYRYESGNLSYLGRATYNYKHKYLLDFVFRTDASTVFAPENYWGFFPGLSAGWVVSDENFFKNNISWMNFLKIRTSWGLTGNNNIKAWKWLQVYTAQTDKGFGFGDQGGMYVTGLTPGVTPNRDVHWDRTLQRNFGLDMEFLHNRLAVTLDQYFNSTTNMLTDMSNALGTPVSVGGAFAEQNYAAVNTWGTELSVNWKDQKGDFSYSIGMNTSFQNYKVERMYDQAFGFPADYTKNKFQGSYGVDAVWGYKTWKQTSGGDGILRTDADIDNYWNYLTQNAAASGVPDAGPKFFDIDKKSDMKKGMLVYEDVGGPLNAETRTIAGPDGHIKETEDFAKIRKSNRSYGINTNISVGWKNLSLTAQLSTSWGGANFLDYVRQSLSSSAAFWSQPIYLTDMYDEQTNPKGKYPNMGYYEEFDGANSDFFLMPTFRMYVRTLSVGYTLPKKIVNKAKLSSARFFISGNNLWDFYNPYPKKFRNMYDPADVGYPTLRTWALGVNIGF